MQLFKKGLLATALVLMTISMAAQKTTIKGSVENYEPYGSTVTLDNIVTEETVATAEIKNGSFTIEAEVEKTDFYRLSISDEKYVILILAPSEKITMEWNVNEMLKPEIKGSKHSQLVYQTFGVLESFDEKIKEATAKIEQDKEEYLLMILTENSSSLATLFFIDNLDMESNMTLYNAISTNLNKTHSDHPFVQDLTGKVNDASKLAIGSLAPEIDLASPDGTNIKLSSLRGKYVLIDFWAAWCRPCRAESPNMVAAYNTYHAKGFEIYSVSLDEERADWLAAIEKDGLSAWSHVSDLKGWQSEAGGDYGVDGIPFTVLIDKEGKIIAKGLRGDELKEKLKELFD